MMQVNIDEYAHAIKELVKEYLQTVAVEKATVESMSDVIVIQAYA